MTARQQLKNPPIGNRPRFNLSLDLSLASLGGHQWALGVEAAETGESDAPERERECCARDGTVDEAQYVIVYCTGHREEESMSGSPVSLVGLVYLVHLVGFVEATKRDRPNRPDRRDRPDRLEQTK